MSLDLDDFDYDLPPEQIAQEPPPERDGGRLLRLPRTTGPITHGTIRDLPDQLREGDLLVLNTTRVLTARLRGEKDTGGRAEALLLAESGPGRYRALLRMRGRQRVGQKLVFSREGTRVEAEIAELAEDGAAVLAFSGETTPYEIGEMPLPPYIRREGPRAADTERYQTTFGHVPGSVAAPTAGLHLTPALLEAIAARGVERAEVVLHVGIGTFRPIDAETVDRGELHPERYVLPPETVDAVARARERGGRVVAIGTTATRVLESCANADGSVRASSGETRLFLQPGARFRVVDALLTNFHLPRSSLLLLVAAFAGRERVLDAYREAVAQKYRFFSYGDAMWIA